MKLELVCLRGLVVSDSVVDGLILLVFIFPYTKTCFLLNRFLLVLLPLLPNIPVTSTKMSFVVETLMEPGSTRLVLIIIPSFSPDLFANLVPNFWLSWPRRQTGDGGRCYCLLCSAHFESLLFVLFFLPFSLPFPASSGDFYYIEWKKTDGGGLFLCAVVWKLLNVS